MKCPEKAFLLWLTLLFPSSSPIFDICPPESISPHRIWSVRSCGFNLHKWYGAVSYFLLFSQSTIFSCFSMLLFGELVFYFFLILSIPSYAATVFYSFILLMMTTGVASTFHHHTQQKRPLWAGFLRAEMRVKWEWWVASMTAWSKAPRCRHPWCVETTARTSYSWNEERVGQLEAEDKEVAAGPCRP